VNDTAQNRDLRRFESITHQKIGAKSVFSADFGGVSCREASKAQLQEQDWDHHENISSRMFETDANHLRCRALGFAFCSA
jgi:hypothetical protein